MPLSSMPRQEYLVKVGGHGKAKREWKGQTKQIRNKVEMRRIDFVVVVQTSFRY